MLNELEYVERFGHMMKNPRFAEEVEHLLLTIPDAHTFTKIRRLFYERYKNPFLPSFLYDLNPDKHIRILNAYKIASGDYQ